MDQQPQLNPQRELDSIRHMMDALNCGALLVDRAANLVHVNPRLCAMIKVPAEKLLGANLLSFYTNESDRDVVAKSLGRFEEQNEMEFFLPLPDGGKLPIITSARPLTGPPPLSDHRIITVNDISQQKETEAAGKQQYQWILEMSDTLLQQALELKHYSQKLENRVRERTAQLQEAHMDAIYMLAVASEAKDQDTGRHVRRVEHATREIARRVGFADSDAEAIGYSSILHDVGKIHIPDGILTKAGPLDADERRRMQEHTLVGERILLKNPFFERARKIARGHHENWDGSGYPDNLSRDVIPIEARIVHVADVFDALTHDRVYKKAWSASAAIEVIHKSKGSMFDPEVVEAFDRAFQDGVIRNGDATS